MLVFEAVVYEAPAQQAEIQLDESLFSRIAAEDKEAFLTLYEKCSSAVFAYALSILRNRTEAEDAMQDTYLKIRSAAHLYRPMGRPVAWIITITRNVCLMQLREKSRTAWTPPDENSYLHSPTSSAFDAFGDAEDRLVLTKMLDLLSEEDRQIIVLHAISGMKHREIAQVMSLPLSTVLAKYRRALQKLRDAFAE